MTENLPSSLPSLISNAFPPGALCSSLTSQPFPDSRDKPRLYCPTSLHLPRTSPCLECLFPAAPPFVSTDLNKSLNASRSSFASWSRGFCFHRWRPFYSVVSCVLPQPESKQITRASCVCVREGMQRGKRDQSLRLLHLRQWPWGRGDSGDWQEAPKCPVWFPKGAHSLMF